MTKIRLIYGDGFPNGKACANRMYLYAKGLHENGCDVEVIVFKPTESYLGKSKNNFTYGEINGVKFRYSNSTCIRSKYFVLRRLQDLYGLLKTSFMLITKHSNSDAIILASCNQFEAVVFSLFCRLSKIKVIRESSEIPFHYCRHTVFTHLNKFIYEKYVLRLFDGFLVISAKLEEYLSERKSRRARLLRIPVLIDPQEFSTFKCSVNGKFTIVYAGSMNEEKDGVLTIIKAFNEIVAKWNAKLILIGSTKNSIDQDNINNLIQTYKLKDKIYCTGYISREKLLEYFKDAQLLVLAKPKSIEAEYCLPSKIGEYLITGKPMLTTAIGEIQNYLHDGENAFLVQPNDYKAFADKIEEIFENYNNAKLVGSAGKHTAQNSFNYLIHTKIIKEFIEKYAA